VLIESQWEDAESDAGAGSIRLRAWGQNAETLLDPLLETLKSLPVGPPQEIKRLNLREWRESKRSKRLSIRLIPLIRKCLRVSRTTRFSAPPFAFLG
jgi:hypothetical protein